MLVAKMIFSFSESIDASKISKSLQIDFRCNNVFDEAVDNHFLNEIFSEDINYSNYSIFF